MSQTDSDSPAKLGPHAPSFLATEHWGLLATRSMIYNETFSRVSTFLTTLSASAVALALAADASGFGRSFRIFALVLFPMVFFLGVTAYIRICQINVDDIYLLAAMNRLRRAYIDESPEIEQYMTSGWSDDEAGVWQSLTLGRTAGGSSFQLFVTTPTILATINAAIAVAAAALALSHNGVSGGWLVALCSMVFVATWVGLMSVQLRMFRKLERNAKTLARFPGTT